MLTCLILAGTIYISGPEQAANLSLMPEIRIERRMLRLESAQYTHASFDLTKEQAEMRPADLVAEIIAPCEQEMQGGS